MGRRRLHYCYPGSIRKEQIRASHRALVVEQRGLVAAKLYFGVDQTVIIRSGFLDRGRHYRAVAQSQIQIDVFSRLGTP